MTGVAVGMRKTEDVKSPRDLVVGITMAVSSHLIMAFGILMVRDVISEHSVVWISAYRFLVATIVLSVVSSCFLSPRKVFLGFTRRDIWKLMLPMSFLGPFMGTMLWTAGFKYTSVGRAAIYNQLSTVFIILLAVLFLKERLTGRKVLGLALAVSGAIVVALQK